MNRIELLKLIEKALELSLVSDVSLRRLIEVAARVAEHVDDLEAKIWLISERDALTEEERKRFRMMLVERFGEQEAHIRWKQCIQKFISSRELSDCDSERLGIEKGQSLGMSVAEIEDSIQFFEEMADTIPSRTPANLPPQEERKWHMMNLESSEKYKLSILFRRQVLERIRRKVIDFLITSEAKLWLAAEAESLFVGPSKKVQDWLAANAPNGLEQLKMALCRLEEGGLEARTHALTSLRRLIKTIADFLYPPMNEPVQCSDGIDRQLGEDQYLNRLREFAAARIQSKTSKNLVFSAFEDLDRRLDLAHDLACKGVHAEVTEFEVRLCIMQTYFLLGEMLALKEDETMDR
ncbi:hypothetical protein NDA01_23300 [Trichocoleus desertorum AS-A10]|uniref:hypothetical protein n=1 Tax=Trichocoleus desertorum TaxID=1481672 RepID=UPI003299A7D4